MRTKSPSPVARAALCCTLVAAGLLAAGLGWILPAAAQEQSFSQVQRGKVLVDAGDCLACHTQNDSKPFAGGRAVETPFGTIYSPNITPAPETGIGRWSDEDFYQAMHTGVGPDGTKLYPAFPYPYFTKMPRDDVMAVRAYLNTLQPIESARPDNKLTWPLNHRVFMNGWNLMFFTPGTFAPDPSRSAEWNRGAYLVEGPGHCGACHTPKNALGGDKSDEALRGGQIQNWFVPNISNDPRTGVGSWSADEIVEYLKTGRNARSGAAALMSDVVTHSTAKMSDADLQAIAIYLKSVPAAPERKVAAPDRAVMEAGEAIYLDSCSACHRSDGNGVAHMFPPLAKNANVQSDDPTTLIRMILQGARTAVTDQRPTPSSMPAYGWKLDDGRVAAVATYVRNAWGNSAPAVSAAQVRSLKTQLAAVTQ
jgi:mono/diheme cytochrome c family protein